MKLADIDELARLAARRMPAALVTDLISGAQFVTGADGLASGLGGEATSRLRRMIADDASGETELDGRRCFVLVRSPAARLAIVGAVHITQALAPMAGLAGYEVFVIDPRGAFATAERFPGVTLSTEWPDDAMRAIGPDSRTAVVTLTHDPKFDDPALVAALRSPAFYIGALGSRKTHAARLDRLRKAGFGDDDLGRIHGPAGLDIGARTPAEIAVSVLAEMTAWRRGKTPVR